jgi:hypothetical protein
MARFCLSFLPAELETSPLSLREGRQSINVISVSRDSSGIGIHV